MRARILVLCLTLAASACSLPFRSSSEERKANCDRIAARAIQTTSLEDAQRFATQAAQCYSEARGD